MLPDSSVAAPSRHTPDGDPGDGHRVRTGPGVRPGLPPGLAVGRGALGGPRAAGSVSLGAGRSFLPAGLAAGGTIRHVADPGVGTAYVVDRAGGDVLITVTTEGTASLPQPSEVAHPAWSSDGDLAWATGTSIAVRDARTGRVEHIRSPVPGGSVFSPVFLAPRRLVAVSSPRTTVCPRANVWGTCERRTSMGPLAPADRVPGRRRSLGHREDPGRQWAWHRLRSRGRPRLGHPACASSCGGSSGVPPGAISSLDEERYLAGLLGERLVWNVPDPLRGRQMLAVEGRTGLHTIGCGAVAADPLDVVDPDRRPGRGIHVPARGDWPELGRRRMAMARRSR